MFLSTFANKVIGDKRRWRAYKARTRTFPEPYRTTIDALERYLMYFGAADADTAATMFDDLADLIERAAADQTPIRTIVGEDPVEFVETFLQNYGTGSWITRERQRLTTTIARAEHEGHGTP